MGYDRDKVASRLSDRGWYTIQSDFNNVLYGLKSGSLAIFAGKNGTMSVDVDRIPELIDELKGIYEDSIDRRRLRIKGA